MDLREKFKKENAHGVMAFRQDDYVEWLEAKVKNLSISIVSQQRELLIAFSSWMDENVNFDGIRDEEIDSYLTELKSNL